MLLGKFIFTIHLSLVLFLSVGSNSIPSLYTDKSLFLSAIKQNEVTALNHRVTGITVPHHLLAKDLIAETFSLISQNKYDRIIIISPDHYYEGKTLFSIPDQNLETVFGEIGIDKMMVNLLQLSPKISFSPIFQREHGQQAVLPFLKYYFPEVKVVPVAIKITATQSDLDELITILKPFINQNTLIIQSTDFSHYLIPEIAKQKDQQTLRILSINNPDEVFTLHEPDNLDSRAAQYVQMQLQKEIFGADLHILHNINSQSYTNEDVFETTSYISQIYSSKWTNANDEKSIFLAGDTFFGRFMVDYLGDETKKERLINDVLAVTGGAGMIVNLEGVIMESCPKGLGDFELCMEKEISLEMFTKLNVQAVSIANNHTLDFGKSAYLEMKNILQNAGIRVLENEGFYEFDMFNLVTITDVQNVPEPKQGVIYKNDLDNVLKQAKKDKPLFVFIHWGDEYKNKSGDREKALKNLLTEAGVELIIGSHSHTAGELECNLEMCEIFSLGNFVFDQFNKNNQRSTEEVPGLRSLGKATEEDRVFRPSNVDDLRPTKTHLLRPSGKLLQIQFLEQGTYFLKTYDFFI